MPTHLIRGLFPLRYKYLTQNTRYNQGFPHSSVSKESACNAGDSSSTPGSGRSPGEGKGYPLQYSGLENSMDCIVHRVTKSQTRLSNFHFHFSSLNDRLHRIISFRPHTYPTTRLKKERKKEKKASQRRPIPSKMMFLELVAAAAKSLQSCLTLCDPIEGSPPDSSLPGILQERTLEQVAISFSNA